MSQPWEFGNVRQTRLDPACGTLHGRGMVMLRTVIVTLAVAAAVPLIPAASASPAALSGGPVYTEATLGSTAGTAAPASPPSGVFTPAPMPDVDRQSPLPGTGDRAQTRIAPKLYHTPGTYNGEGYVFGSTVQDEQDQRIRPGAGVNLIMPLQ